jgi:hypothetical protein
MSIAAPISPDAISPDAGALRSVKPADGEGRRAAMRVNPPRSSSRPGLADGGEPNVAAGRGAEQIRSQVRRLLTPESSQHAIPQRRDLQRHAYPQLVRLTPVDPATLVPQGETVVVVGKHLSERGLGFYHREPLPHRHVVVVVERDATSREGGDALAFLMDVSWCRFTRHGWYESGGRFLQAVPATSAGTTERAPPRAVEWPVHAVQTRAQVGYSARDPE